MRTLKAELLVLVVFLSIGLLFGLSEVLADDASEQAYELVDPDLEPFRADFNAASEHVRAVLLVGPT